MSIESLVSDWESINQEIDIMVTREECTHNKKMVEIRKGRPGALGSFIRITIAILIALSMAIVLPWLMNEYAETGFIYWLLIGVVLAIIGYLRLPLKDEIGMLPINKIRQQLNEISALVQLLEKIGSPDEIIIDMQKLYPRIILISEKIIKSLEKISTNNYLTQEPLIQGKIVSWLRNIIALIVSILSSWYSNIEQSELEGIIHSHSKLLEQQKKRIQMLMQKFNMINGRLQASENFDNRRIRI